MEAGQTARKEWGLAHTPCQPAPPAEDDVVVLQPGEEKVFEFDFHDERWLVEADNSEPIEIGTLDWSERFRLIYRLLMKPIPAIWKTTNSSGMDICPPEHFMLEAGSTDTFVLTQV